MFGQDRDAMRRFFAGAWRKHKAGDALEPLETIVAQVIGQHPEYHAVVENPERLQQDFSPADGTTNPFLHMGMHITLAEQLGSDRPVGIRTLHRQITLRAGDAHEAEHLMMECLGLVLWEAQRAGRMPDEAAYLDCMRKLAR